MSQGYYAEELKRDAVSQIIDNGYSIKEVAVRLGVKKMVYNHKKHAALM